MNPIEKVIQIAKNEIGYIEKATNSQLDSKTANPGDADYTKYARDLDALGMYNGKKNGYWWCDMFVDWCFVTAFGLEKALEITYQVKGGLGAGCTYSARYFKNNGRFFKSNPKAGDQIFFSRDGGQTCYHTGLVTYVGNGKVHTIEGNTSSAPGTVPNGGAVSEKSYSLSYSQIAGYGRPNYALITDDEGDDDMITQEQFEQMYAAMRKKLQDNDAGNYSKEAREWAIASKLVFGSSDTTATNGQPNYMWQDYLTREQFFTVLMRFEDRLRNIIDFENMQLLQALDEKLNDIRNDIQSMGGNI